MHFNFDGTLGVMQEPDSAGIAWTLECPKEIDSVDIGLEGHLLLCEGDLLTIWDEYGREIFHRTIRLDHNRDWTPFPEQRTKLAQWMADHWDRFSLSQREVFRFFLCGMPRVNGIWIVWTQRGVETHHWLDYFMPRADQSPLRARVMRPRDPQKMVVRSQRGNLIGGNIVRS